MKTFKSYMLESKERTEKLATLKFAMLDAATLLELFIDPYAVDTVLTAKQKTNIKRIIKNLQIGAREILK